jgi:hypothetical protein
MAESKGQAKGHGHSKMGAHGHGGKHKIDQAHEPQDGGSQHLLNNNMHENVYQGGGM